MLLNMAGPEALPALLRGGDSGAWGESLRVSVICEECHLGRCAGRWGSWSALINGTVESGD